MKEVKTMSNKEYKELIEYINNDKYETFKCYQHRKRKQFLETAGTILTIILFFITLYLAFISLPLS